MLSEKTIYRILANAVNGEVEDTGGGVLNVVKGEKSAYIYFDSIESQWIAYIYSPSNPYDTDTSAFNSFQNLVKFMIYNF